MQTADKISPNREFPPSVHAYCRSSALCVSFAIDRGEKPTVVLEFAEKGHGSSYNWPEKLSFQLNQGELAELCAFLRKPWTSHKWVHQSHPAAKALVIRHQAPNILFEISAGKRHVIVPVIPRDQYFIRNLLMSRLIEIQPSLPLAAHHESLDQLSHALARK